MAADVMVARTLLLPVQRLMPLQLLCHLGPSAVCELPQMGTAGPWTQSTFRVQGVILFELFLGCQLADIVLSVRSWGEAKEFAKAVAKGLRVKTDMLPVYIAPIIASCWHQVHQRDLCQNRGSFACRLRLSDAVTVQ